MTFSGNNGGGLSSLLAESATNPLPEALGLRALRTPNDGSAILGTEFTRLHRVDTEEGDEFSVQRRGRALSNYLTPSR